MVFWLAAARKKSMISLSACWRGTARSRSRRYSAGMTAKRSSMDLAPIWSSIATRSAGDLGRYCIRLMLLSGIAGKQILRFAQDDKTSRLVTKLLLDEETFCLVSGFFGDE